MNRYYTKMLDNGTTAHNVTVDHNDNIVDSSLETMNDNVWSNEKQLHAEYIGKSKNYLRGKGYKKVIGPKYYNTMDKKWHGYTSENNNEICYEYPGERENE